jgi:hypothetical protein
MSLLVSILALAAVLAIAFAAFVFIDELRSGSGELDELDLDDMEPGA